MSGVQKEGFTGAPEPVFHARAPSWDMRRYAEPVSVCLSLPPPQVTTTSFHLSGIRGESSQGKGVPHRQAGRQGPSSVLF